jgi:ankyrin repeat protein
VPAQASAPSSRHAETSTEESKHKSLARQGTLLQGQFDDSYSRIQYERNTCSGGTIIPIWSKEEPEFRRFLEQLPPLHRSAADGTLTYGQLEEYTPEELNEPWNCPDSVYRHDRTGWDFIGAPPIHFAAYFGNVQSLFLLLDKGAGIEEKDAAGTTALHAAAWTGNAEIFKILMNREADLEAHDLDGWSVEIYALLQNQEYILKLLESYHRDKEVVPDHCTVRAFAKLNKTDMLEAKLNSPTLQNNAREKVRLMTAALCGAAEGGHVDLVRKLLTEAAVADNADESGCTPLHWVGWGGHTEIQVTQLNQSGEREVADRSWNGLRSEQHEEIVKILVVHGASVNKWNLQHCTPLHWVAGAGCIAMAKCFLDYGADRSIVDSEGRTPLRRAEESTDDKMCELLRSYLR